jgi:hypothetical protein
VIGTLGAAAALLLVVSGLAKIRTPAPAGAMIVTLLPRLRRRRLGRPVRAIGGAELAVGGAFLVAGGRVPAALLAGCYLAFLIVAMRLAARRSPIPCGCFGAADAPVGVAHIVLDAVAAGVASAAVVRPVGAAGGLVDHGTLVAVIGVGQAVLLASLGYLAITALPQLTRLREAQP